MHTGTSLFYHSHITHSIEHIDKRTQKYIKHRKQFLKQYYSPLQDKISQLDKQISYYKHLIQNQNEMIQEQKQVSQLKEQIQQFHQTQSYFLSHIDQYHQKILELNIQNNVIQQQILKLRDYLARLTLKKTQQVYNEMNSQRKDQILRKDQLQSSKTIKSQKRSRTLIKSPITSQTLSNNPSTYSNQHYTLLPTIFKIQKYYVNKHITTDDPTSRNKSTPYSEDKNKKQQQYKHLSSINKKTNKDQLILSEPRNELQKKQIQLKIKFKQHITSFNKFQILFKQCFDNKKSHVQKSVTQLQSKLISDRQKFLQICQAINTKNITQIHFSQFQTLTGDQLMTLFISFPWIQKKILYQINHKRKVIVQLQQNKFL